MTVRNVLTLLFLVLLLVACGDSTPTVTTVPPILVQPDESVPYPSTVDTVKTDLIPWYPAPGTPGAPAPGMVMTSGFEPQPGDANLTRAEVFLSFDSSQLILMESMPLQVLAILSGDLPDPCHKLRVAVTAADAHNRINLEVYSLVTNTEVCTTVLHPFVANIPLGTYSGGHFSVYVNGELLGEFDA
jgi:hypothetical protein